MGVDSFTATAIFVAVARLISVVLALVAAWIIHAKAKNRASFMLVLSIVLALSYTLFDSFFEKTFGRYVDREHPHLLDLAYLTVGEALPALVWLCVALAFFFFARSHRAA